MKVQNFINNKFVPSSEHIDSVCPADGTVNAQLPDSTPAEVDAAVKAARAAFPAWSRTPREERARMLRRIADLLEKDLEEFAKLESQDQGKPVWLAREIEIPRCVSNFRFFADVIMNPVEHATHMEQANAVNYVQRMPVGVAGLISPWNLPLYLLTWKIAPCLAFGNTAVCKPSELSSLTAHRLCSIFQSAGLPAGVVNMVFGTGPRTGNALVSHPDVPLISFTGGTVTAQHIIKASAPFYKKLSLELGGKNAGIIFDDADLAQCVPTVVRSSFQNQGEICLCTSRLLVQRGIFEEFMKRYIEGVRALRVGDPSDPNTKVGALICEGHLLKIERYVAAARKQGGIIECGGKRPTFQGRLAGGYYYLPTVISGLPHSSSVCQEEIFGPVVTVVVFDTEEEAITLANDVTYGLAASVWSENAGRLHRVAREIQAGTVWCNCWMLRDLRMPFGGMKQSGVGREGGFDSAEFFTEAKTICIKYGA